VDEVYIAKHLVSAGSEVAVGAPILITVEDPADVAAFESYTLSVEAAPSPPAPVSVKEPSPPPPAPAAAPEVKASTPEPAKNIPAKPLPPTPSPPPAPKAAVVPTGQWGSHIMKSPLLFKIVQEQNNYKSKYGESLHQPLAPGNSGGEK
jgi:pyruvate/2-oxoglutarate dehydrogenase complex dihydrolipoamide acyltransferase (E2) component